MFAILPLTNHPLTNHKDYKKELENLEEKYYKECKKDGNCLYSAISLLIIPLIKKNKNFRDKFFSFNEIFSKVGISSVVYECYISTIEEELLENVNIENAIKENVKDNNLDNNINNLDSSTNELTVFVAYLRLVCSSYLKINKEKYQGFIDRDVKSYCEKFIDPMEQKAGEFEISILSEALEIPIKLVTIVNDEKKGVNRFDINFGEEYKKEMEEIRILHTPDHFEPIYTK